MSKKFDEVKLFYDGGKWCKNRVKNAVGKWITEEEYKQIVGEDYCD